MREEEVKARLLAAGIENAAMESLWLCRALQGEALARAVEKRCTHYPLQYLLGEWDFCRETYEVSSDCLIPRADTELLVEKAIGLLPSGARFLDLCTGSGCIAVSTLAARQDTTALAVDLFPQTLALAARNALRNHVAARVEFRCADVTENPAGDPWGRFDAILSNPPYISSADMLQLQREVRYEPTAALAGGEDGLDFYRAILQKWTQLLTPNGFILFEIGYDQGEALCALAREHGFAARVFKDLGGNDRTVHLTRIP